MRKNDGSTTIREKILKDLTSGNRVWVSERCLKYGLASDSITATDSLKRFHHEVSQVRIDYLKNSNGLYDIVLKANAMGFQYYILEPIKKSFENWVQEAEATANATKMPRNRIRNQAQKSYQRGTKRTYLNRQTTHDLWQMTLDGQFVAKYSGGVEEVVRKTGFGQSNIRACSLGISTNAGGYNFIWVLKD